MSRSAIIQIRVTAAEHARLTRAAHAADEPISSWVRAVALTAARAQVVCARCTRAATRVSATAAGVLDLCDHCPAAAPSSTEAAQ